MNKNVIHSISDDWGSKTNSLLSIRWVINWNHQHKILHISILRHQQSLFWGDLPSGPSFLPLLALLQLYVPNNSICFLRKMIFPQKNTLHRFIRIFGYSEPSSGNNSRLISRHRMGIVKYIMLDLKETRRPRQIV